MLATQRQTCHLVSWSPTGCHVFELERDRDYQRELHAYLRDFLEGASALRPLGDEAAERARRMRERSKVMAREAALVGNIDAHDCVTLVDNS